MRTVAITVHNNRKLELFVEGRKEGFEVWIVGPVRRRRTLLDHRLTHDDLETRLQYAEAGDLVWRDGAEAEIPVKKHRNAIETEGTIERGTFWDYDNPLLDETEAMAREAIGLPKYTGPSRRNVANHLGAIVLLSEDTDEAERTTLEDAILGRWTDGVVTMCFERGHKLQWSCAERQHPLNVGERSNGHLSGLVELRHVGDIAFEQRAQVRHGCSRS